MLSLGLCMFFSSCRPTYTEKLTQFFLILSLAFFFFLLSSSSCRPTQTNLKGFNSLHLCCFLLLADLHRKTYRVLIFSPFVLFSSSCRPTQKKTDKVLSNSLPWLVGCCFFLQTHTEKTDGVLILSICVVFFFLQTHTEKTDGVLILSLCVVFFFLQTYTEKAYMVLILSLCVFFLLSDHTEAASGEEGGVHNVYPWHCLVPFLTNTTPSQPPQPAPPPTASPAPKYEHASPRGSQSDRLTAATTTATTAGGGDTGMYVFWKIFL